MQFGSIAVTGGNGGLGQAIINNLSAHARVTSLDITPGQPGVRSRYADVLSKPVLKEALEGHDAIVHVAALLLPTDPEESMFNTNVVGTWNVLKTAEELGIQKVVLISSECASGIINIQRMEQSCPDYLPIDKTHPERPLETYGLSKLLSDVAAESFARRGKIKIVSLRPTLILMPGMEAFVRKVRESDDPDLWSYVEVCDVVEAVHLALEYEGPAYDCFYLSARDTYAKEETLKFMERKFGRLPEVRDPDLYRLNPYAAIWDLTRCEKVLGLKPKSDWRQFIAKRKEFA